MLCGALQSRDYKLVVLLQNQIGMLCLLARFVASNPP